MGVGNWGLVLASRRGGYWGLANGHIQKWRGDHLESGYDWNYPWDTNTTPVRAACEDQEGNLVVGTGGEGVFWFDSHGDHVQLLSTDTILSLCTDRQGDLWVGTDGRGLSRVRRKFFEVLEESRGSTVQSVCQDGQNGLWIGYFAQHGGHSLYGQLESFR